MVPKLQTIRHLVEFGDTHSILVGGDVLGYDIHGHLAEIHVGADARGGGDSCVLLHGGNHLAC